MNKVCIRNVPSTINPHAWGMFWHQWRDWCKVTRVYVAATRNLWQR